MKYVIVLIGVFLLFTTSAFGELTQTDIEKIRSIVEESEKDVKEYVDLKIKELDGRLSGEIKTSNQSLSETIKGLDKRLYQIFVLVIALIAFIAVVVGVPQIIVAMQRKDLHEQDERIKAQQNQIEALRHEIDERKHEHIAAP